MPKRSGAGFAAFAPRPAPVRRCSTCTPTTARFATTALTPSAKPCAPADWRMTVARFRSGFVPAAARGPAGARPAAARSLRAGSVAVCTVVCQPDRAVWRERPGSPPPSAGDGPNGDGSAMHRRSHSQGTQVSPAQSGRFAGKFLLSRPKIANAPDLPDQTKTHMHGVLHGC